MNVEDVAKLTETDKAELVQFINNETQRAKVNARVHSLAGTCWKKCIPSVRGSALDKSEEACLANCVNRFFDITLLTTRHLNNMRNS